ncbi:hypothetical protein HH214_08980 [Mucilaginibacter robiniae]|uniref:Uncharacterized protein n=1 Tax=Mucilaginibacter robiniae TaxID=2728022 RepID=A0A7L5DYY5_9SPHI|nr:hypothetical protein [Mucilaginibacter robiniae]QJD96001.1 hypothetical protein HH214_08980 [Mucilaginibacter robiniae]
MIKKLFITFLAVLYLGVSSGATLHYQYCMGRLIKVTLWHSGSNKSRPCGMEQKAKAKKCCTDKHQQLKSDKSGSITYSEFSLGTSAAILASVPFSGGVSSHFVPITEQYPVSQAPPSGTAVPVFLRNCTFRI